MIVALVSSFRHLRLIERGFGRLNAFLRSNQQHVGWHDQRIKPVNRAAAFDAAGNSHVAPNGFGQDIGNKELLQPEQVGPIGFWRRHRNHRDLRRAYVGDDPSVPVLSGNFLVSHTPKVAMFGGSA